MDSFHTLRIKEKILETSQCVSLIFDIPDDLRQSFAYQAGQYLTLKSIINGEEVRRSYSLCSSPHEHKWQVAIKKVPKGKFSTYAMEELKEGQEIGVMAPEGGFIQKKKEGQLYVFFAAGSGITPILSLIKDILHHNSTAQVMLFYGNKSSDQIIFKEEIESLKNIHLDRFQHFYFLTQEVTESDLFNGRLNADKLKVFAKVFFDANEVDEYFICGPEAMIWSIKEGLESLGVKDESIRFELFNTSSGSKGKDFVGHLREEERGEKSEVTIILDGQESDLWVGYQDQSILDAALQKNHDLPFACKGGVCCTCKAKLEEGEVEMEVNYALEPDEIEAGFILTCQSHPRSKKLRVNFDV